MTERKKAPEEVMIVGYWLTEARTTLADGVTGPYGGNSLAWGYAYLTSAVAAVPAARESLERDLKNRQMWQSDGLYDIDRACIELKDIVSDRYVDPMRVRAKSNLIGRGHQKLARMLARLGYAEITDDDFNKLRRTHNLPGGGGGR